MGNQYVRTFSLAKVGGFLGKASFGVGVLLDGIGVYNYYQNRNSPNAVSPGKFGMDTGMGTLGLTGVGTIPSITYFGIDAFYPGGTNGNAKDMSNQLLNQSHDNEPNMTNNPIFLQ